MAAILLRIAKMYAKYYRYTSQGVPVTGFPLPLLGELLSFMKIKSEGDYAESRIISYYKSCLGPNLPGIFLSFINPLGYMIVQSP